MTEGSYISSNIIDKNMRNIYNLIYMSFKYIIIIIIIIIIMIMIMIMMMMMMMM